MPIKSRIRTIPHYPKKGIMFRDITTLLGDARAFRRAVDEILTPFAGAKVDTGSEAEAFSRYIGLHLSEVNEGATYSETSGAAREEGLDPTVAADLQVKADTLFKGETLRSILLNAYGWWTVSTIAVYVGYAMVIAGLLLGLLAFLGFRHAKRATPINATA